MVLQLQNIIAVKHINSNMAGNLTNINLRICDKNDFGISEIDLDIMNIAAREKRYVAKQ